MRKETVYERYFKRPLDVFCSGLALVVLSPVMGVTALMVRSKLGSPVLFTQDRPGKDEKIFKLYKFRTMTDERDENGELLPDEIRLTKFGKLLRSTSLDELPSLINIFRGDMSVVGPRPLLVRYLPRYESENNISSAIIALDYMRDGCYFCEADLYISNPEVILKYQYSSNILGAYSMETDDWSFKMQDGCVSEYKKGNTFCYNYYGISYWTPEDCKKLCADWAEVYSAPEGKDLFWEFVPFINKRSNYRVEIRPCRKQDTAISASTRSTPCCVRRTARSCFSSARRSWSSVRRLKSTSRRSL